MKRLISGFALLMTVTMLGGCEFGADSRILSVHLVDHFRQNGFEGRFRRINGEKIGAEQAGRFVRQNEFDVELARFDDERKARRMQKRGFNGFKVYAHGRYIMLIRRAESEKKLVKVFRKF